MRKYDWHAIAYHLEFLAKFSGAWQNVGVWNALNS